MECGEKGMPLRERAMSDKNTEHGRVPREPLEKFEKRDRIEQPCEICWTNSWEPCEEGTEDALALKDGSGFVVCAQCQVIRANEKLRAECERMREAIARAEVELAERTECLVKIRQYFTGITNRSNIENKMHEFCLQASEGRTELTRKRAALALDARKEEAMSESFKAKCPKCSRERIVWEKSAESWSGYLCECGEKVMPLRERAMSDLNMMKCPVCKGEGRHEKGGIGVTGPTIVCVKCGGLGRVPHEPIVDDITEQPLTEKQKRSIQEYFEKPLPGIERDTKVVQTPIGGVIVPRDPQPELTPPDNRFRYGPAPSHPYNETCDCSYCRYERECRANEPPAQEDKESYADVAVDVPITPETTPELFKNEPQPAQEGDKEKAWQSACLSQKVVAYDVKSRRVFEAGYESGRASRNADLAQLREECERMRDERTNELTTLLNYGTFEGVRKRIVTTLAEIKRVAEKTK